MKSSTPQRDSMNLDDAWNSTEYSFRCSISIRYNDYGFSPSSCDETTLSLETLQHIIPPPDETRYKVQQESTTVNT